MSLVCHFTVETHWRRTPGSSDWLQVDLFCGNQQSAVATARLEFEDPDAGTWRVLYVDPQVSNRNQISDALIKKTLEELRRVAKRRRRPLKLRFSSSKDCAAVVSLDSANLRCLISTPKQEKPP
jgi:hypothetical protein